MGETTHASLKYFLTFTFILFPFSFCIYLPPSPASATVKQLWQNCFLVGMFFSS